MTVKVPSIQEQRTDADWERIWRERGFADQQRAYYSEPIECRRISTLCADAVVRGEYVKRAGVARDAD